MDALAAESVSSSDASYCCSTDIRTGGMLLKTKARGCLSQKAGDSAAVTVVIGGKDALITVRFDGEI